MLQYLFLFIKQGSKMVIQAAKSILKNVYYTSHTNTLQLSDQSSPSRSGTPHIDNPNLTTAYMYHSFPMSSKCHM